MHLYTYNKEKLCIYLEECSATVILFMRLLVICDLLESIFVFVFI